jgi:hypothetical protein
MDRSLINLGLDQFAIDTILNSTYNLVSSCDRVLQYLSVLEGRVNVFDLLVHLLGRWSLILYSQLWLWLNVV